MTCSICGGSGLIPFVKNGKTIPNASVYCECHQDKPEHYHPPDPSDFDFPCSSAFRGYSYERCGLPDPAYRPSEPEEPKEQVIIHRHSDMGKEEFDLLQQTSLKADWLEKRLNEHTERSKAKSKYKLEG